MEGPLRWTEKPSKEILYAWNSEMAQNSNFLVFLLYRLEISMTCQNPGMANYFSPKTLVWHKIRTFFASNSTSSSMTFWTMPGTLLFGISSLIATEPSRYQVYAKSIVKVAGLQSRINDPALTIAEIPYFCLRDT